MIPCQSCIFSVINDRAAASFLGLIGSQKEGSAARKYSSLYNVQEHTIQASYKRWLEVGVTQAFAAGESVKPLMVAVAQSAPDSTMLCERSAERHAEAAGQSYEWHQNRAGVPAPVVAYLDR